MGRRSAGIVAVLFLVALVGGGARAQTEAPNVSPDERFLRMREAVAAQHLPLFLAYASTIDLRYTVSAAGAYPEKSEGKRRYQVRAFDGVRCGLTEDGKPQRRPDGSPLYLDEPTISPLSFARVVSSELPLFRDSAIQAEPDDTTEARTSRAYRITRSAAETVGGVSVEHLVLEPRSDPMQHPWRDAWIDPSDGRLVRARVVGTIRIEKAYGTIALVLDFANVANVTTVTHVAAEGRTKMGPHDQYVMLRLDETFGEFASGTEPLPACSAFPPLTAATIVARPPTEAIAVVHALPTRPAEPVPFPEPERTADDPPPVAPDERFLRMRDAIAAQHLPRYLAYESLLVSRYRTYGNRPVAARVVRRLDLRVDDGLRCVLRDDQPVIFVGARTMSPLSYARVVSAELPPAQRDAALEEAPDAAEPLRVIGRDSEARTSRYYRITRVGRERLAGTIVEHLKLVPRFEVDKHPWREAWIDPSNNRLLRARVVGVVALAGGSSRITWQLDFAPIGGVTSIVRVFADDHVMLGDHYAEVYVDEVFSDLANAAEPVPDCGAFPTPVPAAEPKA